MKKEMAKDMAKDMAKVFLEADLTAAFARMLRDTEEGKHLQSMINAINGEGYKVCFEIERGFTDAKIQEEARA